MGGKVACPSQVHAHVQAKKAQSHFDLGGKINLMGFVHSTVGSLEGTILSRRNLKTHNNPESE